ncbi:MAG: hypothetical protein ABFR36_06200 [Acidobacteriota bacterium]
MKKRSNESLFGTDGIRSEYGKFPLDLYSIERIGFSIAECMGDVKILIGRDTRISGPEIEERIGRGINNGSEIFSAGVIPTPGLSYNVAHGGFDLGIMITASHNIWSDNGIKLFGPDGEKLPDNLQEKIGEIFYSDKELPGQGNSRKIRSFSGINNYTDFLVESFSGLDPEVSGILLDCANGAASETAPLIFSKLDINHIPYNFTPDGKNINSGCGSTEPDFIKRKILSGEGTLGIMFDGDGDRVLMVDGAGRELDGDFILFIISKYLMKSDAEYNPAVVGTIMSNLSLEREFKNSGVDFFRSDVGDRHVYAEMKRRSAILGGEQSGHIIFSKMQRTGDGILTSLLFLRALEYLGLSVSKASDLYKPFPQMTKSIKIREKRPLREWDELNRMVTEFNEKYSDNSRILIRYSGTERKVRLMIESEDENVLNKNLEIFEKYLISEIGEQQ